MLIELDKSGPEHELVRQTGFDTVYEASHKKGGASRRYAKYANDIIVLHSDGTTGEYYHLCQNGVLVEVGEEVVTGQLIGYSGNTGFSFCLTYTSRSIGQSRSGSLNLCCFALWIDLKRSI